jgi:hypothetical protein
MMSTAHAEVDIAAAPLHQSPRHRGGDDLICAGRHGDGRWDAREHQKRGEQEASAYAEHAGEKADGRTKAHHDQEIHRDLGDGQIDLEHWAGSVDFRAICKVFAGTAPVNARTARLTNLSSDVAKKSEEGLLSGGRDRTSGLGREIRARRPSR